MAEIHVKDPQALLQQAANLLQLSNNISRVAEDITAACTQIGNAWQSDTEDKDSYLKSLTEQMTKVGTLSSALDALSSNLETYAHQQINTANS